MPTPEQLISYIPWLLPVLLLILKFGMKLWVGASHDGPAFWREVLQSPVDVGFLSLSFVASAIIKASVLENGQVTNGKHIVFCFVIFVVYLVLIALSILIWKQTPQEIAKSAIIRAGLLGMFNYSISIPMLVYGISLITV